MSCDNSTISWMGQWFERLMMRLLKWRPEQCRPANRPALRSFPMCRCRSRVRPAREASAGPPLSDVNPVGRRERSSLVPPYWAFVAAVMLSVVCSVSQGDDGQALDRFLTRLGLTDLRLANMERTLARETAPEKRQAVART